VLDCPYCGKPIKDICSAVGGKDGVAPVHFECALAMLGEREVLEKGDVLAYIGGGRFGIVHFNNPQNVKTFKIKKIFEWEDKEHRADWRKSISDQYSAT
jgi:hypothetical protein